MPHALILFPQIPSPTYLDEFVKSGVLRAAAYGDFSSDYAAFAIATGDSVGSLSRTRSDVCPVDPSCLGGLLQPLPVVGSGHEPGEFNLWGFLTLDGGKQHFFAQHFRELNRHGKEGTREATMLVHGIRDVHAVVEVVGDDVNLVGDRFAELIDHEQVLGTSTFVVSKEQTRGWGSERAALA